MAFATTAQPLPAPAYRPPALLQGIQLLVLLELSGSTQKASRLVQLNKPTISRRYRQLARDFALVANRRQAGCRYGSSKMMQLLWLGCRALPCWLERLRQGVLDGALVSGLELQGEEQAYPPSWSCGPWACCRWRWRCQPARQRPRLLRCRRCWCQGARQQVACGGPCSTRA